MLQLCACHSCAQATLMALPSCTKCSKRARALVLRVAPEFGWQVRGSVPSPAQPGPFSSDFGDKCCSFSSTHHTVTKHIPPHNWHTQGWPLTGYLPFAAALCASQTVSAGSKYPKVLPLTQVHNSAAVIHWTLQGSRATIRVKDRGKIGKRGTMLKVESPCICSQ